MHVAATDPHSQAEAEPPAYPTPPDLNIPVWKTAAASPHLLAELDGPSDNNENTFQHDLYRRAVWAPDGSSILAMTESQQKHILSLTRSGPVERKASLKSPSPLLDAIWYPVPAVDPSSVAQTWCYAESHRDLPIHLTSSDDGSTRASYSIMNHVEKFVGPHVLAFSPDLSRLYCGLWSALTVFPLSTPGLNTHSLIPLTSGKHSSGGQRGIVSALATTVDPSNPAHELVAVGTFSGTIGIYSFDPATFPGPTEHTVHSTEEPIAQSSCLAGWREIEGEGITQLRFHPLAPHVLFVASRRSDYIYVYDTRYLVGDTSMWSFKPLAQTSAGVRTAHLLAKLPRRGGASHQRMHVDVDWAGRWLVSGDEDGDIHLWRIDTGRFTDSTDMGPEEHDHSTVIELTPDLSWKAHDDVVGSVSFHPFEPWLVSVSGSRRWPEQESISGSDDDSDTSVASLQSQRRAWHTNDSSLKIWSFSEPPTAPL